MKWEKVSLWKDWFHQLGTFGKVIECWDREYKRRVAVKIIKAVERYTDAAMIEIDILKEVADKSKDMKSSCIQLLDWFEYKRHVCMIFEKCGLSLYDFLRKNHFQPFMLSHVQSFAKQLLEALECIFSFSFLWQFSSSWWHETNSHWFKAWKYFTCWFWLQNREMGTRRGTSSIQYLLKSQTRIPKHREIKLIDFGSATFEDQHHTKIVSTRHYRAPEVILGNFLFSFI